MRRRLLILSILLTFAVPVGATGEAKAATIKLKTEVDVVPDTVLLGDVATVTGDEDAARLEALRSIPICSSPPPAETQILSSSTIVWALRASGADLSNVKLAGNARVLVRRRHELVTADELGEAFSTHVSHLTGWDDGSFLVEPPKNCRPIPVPVGERIITVETFPDEDFCGSVLAHFLISVDGQPYCEPAHRFVVERYVEALVALRKIKRGESLQESDFEIQKVKQSVAGEDRLTEPEQITGLLAGKTIFPGRVLVAGSLEKPPIVKRGQTATVMWEGDGFSIAVQGRLLEDGCEGELVRVRLSSRHIVKACVVNSRTLRIARKGERDGKSPGKNSANGTQGKEQSASAAEGTSKTTVSRYPLQRQPGGSLSGSQSGG